MGPSQLRLQRIAGSVEAPSTPKHANVSAVMYKPMAGALAAD
jgi:hypothetical protein